MFRNKRYKINSDYKKENSVTINYDLGNLVTEILKDFTEIKLTLKEINESLKNALTKIELLEKRVEKLENESKLHR